MRGMVTGVTGEVTFKLSKKGGGGVAFAGKFRISENYY